MHFANLHVLRRNFKYQHLKCSSIAGKQQRYLWQWLHILFNKIDHERLQKVGPDRNCAEWILKNGGSVRFEVQNEFISDYMNLAPETSSLVRDHLIEIYADGASIHDYGFYHLENCRHIQKVTFISCKLIGDKGLERLQLFIKNSLKYLEIRSCHGITDKGILSLTELRNLDKLILSDLRGIVDKSKCEDTVKQILQKTDCVLNI